MTNQIFSANRFTHYFKLFICENWKKLLTTTGSLIGTMIVLQVLLPVFNGCYSAGNEFGSIDPMWVKLLIILWIILFISVATWSGALLSSYASKNRRFSLLTLPASNFEKFLTYFIIYVIGIYVIFFIGMETGNYLRVWTAPLYAAKDAIIEPLPFKYFLTLGKAYFVEQIDPSAYNPERIEYLHKSMYKATAILLCCLFIMQSYFVLCSTVWPKNGIRYGILACVILSILFSVTASFGAKLFFGDNPITTRYGELSSYSNFFSFCWVISLAICLINYGIAFLRFKELETINRW